MIIWEKMPWLFQEARLTRTWADVDSQGKALTSISSTPLARAGWGHLQSRWICRHHGAEVLPGCDQFTGEKKGMPEWLAPCNLWIAVLWLESRNGSEGGHRRNYVTRWSWALVRAHLFSASTNVLLSWLGRGDLPRKKDIVRLGWWHMPQECYPMERKYICR